MTDAPPSPGPALPPRKRGRLKVFLGAAPGVGKTWAMLDDARRAHQAGTDVIAAVVETHGRRDTEAMLEGIPVLPRRVLPYKGRELAEMDLDALLARAPRLALVDELAHSNVEGSRHEKRWQDVEEVLAAGIDVYTTVNVQHLETLNDAVARITGVRVRETVPDRVLQAAEEIELIDVPPEELLERLRDGKVYVPEQAARATENFFTRGNLSALRELSLRAAADQVDARLRTEMDLTGAAGPWPVHERVLVIVDDGPAAKDAVRAAKRSADRARAGWIALAVTPAGATLRDGAAEALRLAERLGAEVATVEAVEGVVAEVLALARRRNVRRIVLGRSPPRGRLARLLGAEDLGRRLLGAAGDFEVVVTPATGSRAARAARRALPALPADWRPYAEAAGAVAAASAVAAVIDRLFPVASLSLVYMTAVIAVAARRGMGPALAAAALGFLAYNYFFTEPRFTFEVYQRGEVLTLLLFVAASVLTGNLAARLRARVLAGRAQVERAEMLYGFARRVAAAATREDLAWGTVGHVARVLEGEAALLVPGEALGLAGGLDILAAWPPEDSLPVRDLTAATWAWERGEPAGRGTDTLPTARWTFVPVRSGERTLAVLGAARGEGGLGPTDLQLLHLLSDQVGLALERERLARDLEGARLASETERLRAALLNSVSHDLRTPLVSIIGAAGTLADAPGLPDDARATLLDTIREEGERMDRYVQNLLDMTRLGHGALRPRLAPVDAADLVGAARTRLGRVLHGHPLVVDLAPGLPPLMADHVLTEQVLVNLLDNAAKYAPPGTSVRIEGRASEDRVALAVSDEGPGIPEAERERVFDVFHRVEQGDRRPPGTGLGLAIARGLLEAQGGAIRAEAARPDGTGARLVVTLPAALAAEAAA